MGSSLKHCTPGRLCLKGTPWCSPCWSHLMLQPHQPVNGSQGPTWVGTAAISSVWLLHTAHASCQQLGAFCSHPVHLPLQAASTAFPPPSLFPARMHRLHAPHAQPAPGAPGPWQYYSGLSAQTRSGHICNVENNENNVTLIKLKGKKQMT